MVVKNVAGRVAALVGLLVLLPSQAARALDIELPGERKLEVHGFYEFRFRAMGEDIPFGEAGFSPSVSSFRHVLNVETDIDIFPDGWGPFDFMVGYTRWLVSYECAYQRGCGSFPSIDSFGGAHRDPVREPANFKKAYTRTPYAGGVFPQRFFPGSLLSTYQRITPGGRYRDIINPDGVFWNPFPLAPFANLNTRTALDQPIDGGTSNSVAFDTRAGVQNPDRLIAEARLVSSRPELPFLTNVFTGEPVPPFQVLSNRALYPFLDPLTVPGSGGQQLGTGILNGVVRGQFGLAGRADADPQFLRSYGIAPAPAGTDAAALRAAALDTLLNPASVDPNVPAVQSFDSYFPNLIQARPDRNKFVPLAEANSPDLLTMLWGATARADSTFIPWIATIDTYPEREADRGAAAAPGLQLLPGTRGRHDGRPGRAALRPPRRWEHRGHQQQADPHLHRSRRRAVHGRRPADQQGPRRGAPAVPHAERPGQSQADLAAQPELWAARRPQHQRSPARRRRLLQRGRRERERRVRPPHGRGREQQGRRRPRSGGAALSGRSRPATA
jgi:hypothetical protein